MARRVESVMIDGPAGRLEAILEEPEIGKPRQAALVCHPHPLHGGTMHNKVVYRLARGLRRSGAAVLRFNFRGVNLSDGEHDHGQGEVDDARAALALLRARYPDLPYVLAGFSFGSRVALKLGCLATEAGPRLMLAAGFPTVYRDYGFLEDCRRSKIFIQSTRDEFGPMQDLADLVAGWHEAHIRWVEARDHFFVDALDEFEQVVVAVALALEPAYVEGPVLETGV